MPRTRSLPSGRQRHPCESPSWGCVLGDGSECRGREGGVDGEGLVFVGNGADVLSLLEMLQERNIGTEGLSQ